MPPVHINGSFSVSGTTGTTITRTYTPATVGNLLIVGCQWASTTATSCVITDTGGNTWLPAVANAFSSAGSVSIQYCLANGTSLITITATTPSTGFRNIFVDEFSGANVLDQTSNGSGTTGTTLSSGSQTITNANEIIYGCGGCNNSLSLGGGFSGQLDGFQNGAEYKIVSSIASLDAHFTELASSAWMVSMATFFSAVSTGYANSAQQVLKSFG